MRRTGLGAGRLWRIQGQLSEKIGARPIGSGDLLQLIEIGRACEEIVVQPLKMREIPSADHSNLPCPGRRPATQRGKHRTKVPPVRLGGRWCRELVQRSEIPAG